MPEGEQARAKRPPLRGNHLGSLLARKGLAGMARHASPSHQKLLSSERWAAGGTSFSALLQAAPSHQERRSSDITNGPSTIGGAAAAGPATAIGTAIAGGVAAAGICGAVIEVPDTNPGGSWAGMAWSDGRRRDQKTNPPAPIKPSRSSAPMTRPIVLRPPKGDVVDDLVFRPLVRAGSCTGARRRTVSWPASLRPSRGRSSSRRR